MLTIPFSEGDLLTAKLKKAATGGVTSHFPRPQLLDEKGPPRHFSGNVCQDNTLYQPQVLFFIMKV
jgi:hypothetical protein